MTQTVMPLVRRESAESRSIPRHVSWPCPPLRVLDAENVSRTPRHELHRDISPVPVEDVAASRRRFESRRAGGYAPLSRSGCFHGRKKGAGGSAPLDARSAAPFVFASRAV